LKKEEIISSQSGITQKSVSAVLDLLNSGATIPFIARYRKDQTGGLDEVEIASIFELSKKLGELELRKSKILKSLEERDLLTDELRLLIDKTNDINELEDIYLPFKQKRQTRAEKARLAGLEPLAKMLMSQGTGDPESMAARFVKGTVKSEEDALSGAIDIMAEWISENASIRRKLRSVFERESFVQCSLVKGKTDVGDNYRDYHDRNESVRKIRSHSILAMFRGEREGLLSVNAAPDRQMCIDIMERIYVKNNSESAGYVSKAISEAWSRLLRPSLQNELMAALKAKADAEAIKVFTSNLKQLLLAPPLGAKRVLAIDPGYKSGCKIVALDEQGQLLGHDTIYPHPPQSKRNHAQNTVLSFMNSYRLDTIAIGNGTAGRETEQFIKGISFSKDVSVYVVNEDGASIYSASSVGRAEFPNHDVTIRGSVSIGRRLMDPLAELVKIDPKSIGVGQYQHEVDEQKLKESLDQTVQSAVNMVGVELNTASKYLLMHISGLGPQLAENIISWRSEFGPFTSREQLKKVKKMGEKTFEQCAGFLRITEAKNPLDNTALHPESYSVVNKIAKDLKVETASLIRNEELLNGLDLNKYLQDGIGELALQDIIAELKKPGRDPRRRAYVVEFDKKISTPDDLIIGSEMWGVVTNITNFGAFVDVGVKQDGLVHISELADRFISDPFQVVQINQPVKVKVLEVDKIRKRIALSMKQATIKLPPTSTN
jgi:protein Tex